MTGRTTGTTRARTGPGTGEPAADDGLVRALDEALDRIVELSGRVWEARAAHGPEPARRLRRTTDRRCSGCGQAYPCATARALDPGLRRTA